MLSVSLMKRICKVYVVNIFNGMFVCKTVKCLIEDAFSTTDLDEKGKWDLTGKEGRSQDHNKKNIGSLHPRKRWEPCDEHFDNLAKNKEVDEGWIRPFSPFRQ